MHILAAVSSSPRVSDCCSYLITGAVGGSIGLWQVGDIYSDTFQRTSRACSVDSWGSQATSSVANGTCEFPVISLRSPSCSIDGPVQSFHVLRIARELLLCYPSVFPCTGL